MDTEISGVPDNKIPDNNLANPAREPDILQKIFLNESGLRAIWRFLIYLLLLVAIGFVIGLVVGHFVGHARGTPPPRLLYLQEILGFVAVFGAALIMSRIEHRPAAVYGIPATGAFGKLFWQGWFFGLGEICALVGLIAGFGGYTFGSLALHGTDLLRWALIWGVLFVFVGLFEEFSFRGYSQYTLADATLAEVAVLLALILVPLAKFAPHFPRKPYVFAIWATVVLLLGAVQKLSYRGPSEQMLKEGIGFWPAAILLSVGFGAIHLGNPGEGLVGAASVVVVGLFLAFTLKRTGNLWFAIGLHASFDFGETFLFSVPNSGIVMDGHLSNASLHGAKWLTGGTVGPEGSVFSFMTMGILAVIVHYCYPPKRQDIVAAENSPITSTGLLS
ncbi:MAG TPA: CPBP family intramembrane glutamic endopeptidase [Candidatus Eremiobacteraceae bacterium]|nr:CPBP family intramembrane glutamic endopeptidase [Candidatus Eremiobacteraceae bacterium]